MKKITKVVQIVALVSAVPASIISFASGRSTEGIAWGCCALWIVNTLLTESILTKTEKLVEILKEENEKLQNK